MNRRQRLKLIDEINDAFISFVRDYRGTRYEQYFKRINEQIIDARGQLTTQQITNVIERETADLDTSDVAVFGMILGGITTILENARLNREQRNSVAPIVAILGVYSLAKPKLFVTNLHKSLKQPVSVNNQKVNNLLTTYKKTNERALQTIVNEHKRELIKVQRKAKLRMSKNIIQDLEGMAGKPIDTQSRALYRKYNKSIAMKRTVDTEIHANIESAKRIQSKEMGFTKKQWRTQGDNRVRGTVFHNQVADNIVDIDADFEIGSQKAQAPGDQRLQPGDRINCRCYLVYK